MRPPPSIAAEQFGCFTGWQAAAEGWTRDALVRATRRGWIERLRRDVYRTDLLSDADADAWQRQRESHAAFAVAAVLATPGTRMSGAAAAVACGISLLRIPDLACVGGERWLTGSAPGLHLHRCAPHELRLLGDVPCDTPARVVADIAREHGVVAGVVALDHALQNEMTSVEHMTRQLTSMRRWPGVRRAQQALSLADHRSESVLESRSRLAIGRSGLAVPRPQVRLGNNWGGFVGRPDFFWEEFGVIGEVDGKVKYTGNDDSLLYREKLRQETFEELGLIVVRWGKAGVDHFDPIAQRLRRALARGKARPAAERRWTVLPDLALTNRG